MNGQKTKKYMEYLRNEKGIPYLDVRLCKGNEELFRSGYSGTENVTGNERVYMYSATKPMTVVCAMRLIEEGKLSLDDYVETYLPAYADTFLMKDGVATPTQNKMTVRHLFTMSGGLSYNVSTQPIKDAIEATGGKADTVEVVKTPLLFEPGTLFSYSLCHDVLAAVVEKVSGKRFAEYMQEIIFDPLQMHSSDFHCPIDKIHKKYRCSEEGNLTPMEPQNHLTFGDNYDSGGAGVVSTVDDYMKFVVAMTNDGVGENGYRLLKKESIALLCNTDHEAAYQRNDFDCIHGREDYAYGLGLRVRKNTTKWGLPKGEFGWDGAAGTYMMSDPTNKISVVIGLHILSWQNIFKGDHMKLVQCLYEDMQEEGLW